MRAAMHRAIRVGAGIVAAACVIGGYALWRAWSSARAQLPESRCDGHATFVQVQWMDTTLARGKLAIRGCMVDDLLARHEFRGMRRDQVVAIIGPPDPPEPPGSPPLFPEYDMVYWLGPQRGLVGIDSEFLLMKLDGSGRVITVELRDG